MTTYLFVRHATHDLMKRGVVAGRQSGVHLNDFGKQQAEQLAEQLASLPIEAIYSSPLERACETAAPLAAKLRLPLQIAAEFNEIDFGAWTGRSFQDLDDMPEWQQWNRFRSTALTPSGESMLAVQTRALAKISELRTRDGLLAVFTHADVIRAVLAHFLGVHLDLFQRIEIDDASVSVVQLDTCSVVVRLVNGTGTRPEFLASFRDQ